MKKRFCIFHNHDNQLIKIKTKAVDSLQVSRLFQVLNMSFLKGFMHRAEEE